jgi:2,3-bisphosphoglycerate-dependent phosphoglycerate mutase
VTDPERGLITRFSGWADIPLTERGWELAGTHFDIIFIIMFDFILCTAAAGRCLFASGIKPTTVYTSLLKRSKDTFTEFVKQSPELYSKATVINSWRLNERHYGALVGLGKEEVLKLYDPNEVREWRRSWDKKPPKMNEANMALWSKALWTKPTTIVSEPGKKMFTICEKGITVPESESLADCANRVLPLWKHFIDPKIRMGETILVVAHANSIRAMIKHIDSDTLGNENIRDVNVPSATPLVYDFGVRIPIQEYTQTTEEENKEALNPANPMVPLGFPTGLGIRGRYILTKELAGVAASKKHNDLHSLQDHLCIVPTGTRSKLP